MGSKTKRYKEIIRILSADGKTSIKDFAELLQTSAMTIRRDLTDLEKLGLIDRFHGGAVLSNNRQVAENVKYLFDQELELNRLQKDAIGMKAASLIREGETIAFDIGTTSPFIARHLNPNTRITAICQTYECLKELYTRKNVDIMLASGHLNRETNVFYSSDGNSFLSRTRSDRVFISPGGIDRKLGLTCYSGADGEIKRILMQSSREVVMIADSTKMGKIWPTHFADFSDFSKIIIDADVSQEYRALFEGLGIEVILADVPVHG
jgi:DeoR/GlpR family transcriptional regulator of sugar metabolism